MNYTKIYEDLINRSKTRQLTEYCEKHHIIPRSMGGPNTKDNIAKLTGREHFLAHLLLAKIYPKNIGMAIAILRMRGDTRRVTNSKKYEWTRKLCAQRISKHHKKHAKEVQNRPEVKEKHRINAKNRWKDLSYQKRMKEANLGPNNPNYGKLQTKESRLNHAIGAGSKVFKVWKAICIRPDSPRLGVGEYKKGEFIGEFISKSEVEKLLNVKRQMIKRCLDFKMPQASGYIFEY